MAEWDRNYIFEQLMENWWLEKYIKQNN